MESALISYLQQLESRARLQVSVTHSQEAAQLANALYQQGLSDFIDVLDAESQLIDVENDLVQAETEALRRLIALYKSLGGGWEHQRGTADRKPD